MKFEFLPGNRRQRRHNLPVPAPAALESLESRMLLSGAPVVTFPGIAVGTSGLAETSNPQQKIAFTEVPGASGYEIWISDMETRQRFVLDTSIPATAREYTPQIPLQLGVNRVWMRALFTGAAPGPYSAPSDVLLKTVPTITGPTAATPGLPRKLDGNTFPIAWSDVKGARVYEFNLSNQTTQTSTVYRVAARTEQRDALGRAIPDGKGGVLLQDIREFYTSGAVTLAPGTPRPISGASNTSDIEIMLNNHGLKTGEQVRISGVEGNNAANGTFTVTVTGANTFLLKGVSGSGNWTGGGTMVQLTQFRSELPMGQYRLFIRSIDDSQAGRISEWSPGYDFEVAPTVKVLRPSGPSFDTPITVEWEPIADATHYELIVKNRGASDASALVNIPFYQQTSYDLPTSQVSTIAFNGSPTGGTWRLSFRFPGTRVDSTAALPFNATAADIRAAVLALGFQDVTVRTTTAGANPVHELTLRRVPDLLGVTTISNLTTGSVNASTREISTNYGDMEVSVRARRLTQVSDVAITGTPTAGSYRLRFATTGTSGRTVTTAPLAFNATASEVEAAIRLLDGYAKTTVTTRGTAPNLTFSLVMPQRNGQITVTALSELSPGSITNTANMNPRITQTTSVGVSGTPTSGTFQLRFTRPGATGKTETTAALPVNASADVVQAAIRALPGYKNVSVSSRGTAPNLTYNLLLPELGDRVAVAVISALTPGTVAVTGNDYVTGVYGLAAPPTQFSTSIRPVITPLPTAQIYTSEKPTITWNKIDRVAVYRVWVERNAATSVFLKTESPTNSFTFPDKIPAGGYFFWVQAVSTTGELSQWSEPYQFTATGGAPVVLTPANGSTTINPLPEFSWLAVPEATTYEIQVALIGVKFDFITQSGITTTSFTPNNPLTAGTYRYWIRAVLADGTKLPWSTPSTFTVVNVV
ncbi:MAG: LEPR-XLL domain-containing protein [Planctomycetota bacterium]